MIFVVACVFVMLLLLFSWLWWLVMWAGGGVVC